MVMVCVMRQVDKLFVTAPQMPLMATGQQTAMVTVLFAHLATMGPVAYHFALEQFLVQATPLALATGCVLHMAGMQVFVSVIQDTLAPVANVTLPTPATWVSAHTVHEASGVQLHNTLNPALRVAPHREPRLMLGYPVTFLMRIPHQVSVTLSPVTAAATEQVMVCTCTQASGVRSLAHLTLWHRSQVEQL